MAIHRLRVILFALFACCLTSTLLIAQTDLGALKGHVQDQHGSAIAAAPVTLRNPATAFDRTVQTDASGNFSFFGISLTGQYVVSVTAPQFKTAEQNVQLRAATTATVDFTLGVSGEKTEINVYGTTETLPTDSNQVSTRLSQEKIEDTPVVERKITTLPLLNSSVRLSQTTGNLFLNETLFVINGTGRQTTYQLDKNGQSGIYHAVCSSDSRPPIVRLRLLHVWRVTLGRSGKSPVRIRGYPEPKSRPAST